MYLLLRNWLVCGYCWWYAGSGELLNVHVYFQAQEESDKLVLLHGNENMHLEFDSQLLQNKLSFEIQTMQSP